MPKVYSSYCPSCKLQTLTNSLNMSCLHCGAIKPDNTDTTDAPPAQAQVKLKKLDKQTEHAIREIVRDEFRQLTKDWITKLAEEMQKKAARALSQAGTYRWHK